MSERLIAMRATLCRLTLSIVWLALGGCGHNSPTTLDVAEVKSGTARIELNTSGPQGTFDVVGLEAQELAAIARLDAARQAAIIEVHVANDLADPPAMGGEVSIEGGTARFTPRYPLEPGLRYLAVLHRAKLPGAAPSIADVTGEFEIPKRPAQAPTVVEHIYPTAERLPENQLKFYLHFSAPMSRGEAYRHIHLLSADGQEVEGAFLELGEELWDRDQKRFTLLCDPGRVKRGLKPREDLGPVLEEGKSYTLVVDRDWLDASGAPLTESAKKSFGALAPDDEPVDPTKWKIEPPAAGTTDPLVVRFGEPLDHSMLDRVLSIRSLSLRERIGEGAQADAPHSESSDPIAGAIEITDQETCWRFTPTKPWQPGTYELLANTTLEDLAGNSINHAFDIDVFAPIQKKIETKSVSIPFTIAGPEP